MMACRSLLALAVACAMASLTVALIDTSTQPEQIHIALAGRDSTGNSNGMAISWQTQVQTKTSTVWFGLSSDKLNQVSIGSSSSYYTTYDHHVVLSELEPDTVYFYQVGDEDGGKSPVMSFTTAPLSEKTDRTRFAVWGDLGVDHGDSTRNYLNSQLDNIDLMWHAGDISYADDAAMHPNCTAKFCYEAVYNEYMNRMQPMASKKPYMVAPGNHEVMCYSPACLLHEERREKLGNFSAFNSRFRMPSPESNGTLNMWSSFNYGPVHFISMNTETDYPGAPEEFSYYVLGRCGGFGNQLAWLEQDLIRATKERHLRPWILAAGHHPMYHDNTENKFLRAAVEHLFHKYKVDVFFTGHVHSYERDYPIYEGKAEDSYVNPNGTVHIMVGGAGNDEMGGAHVDEPDESHLWAPVSGNFVAKQDKDNFGIGMVDVNRTHLDFKYVRTTPGTVYDSVVIVKSP